MKGVTKTASKMKKYLQHGRETVKRKMGGNNSNHSSLLRRPSEMKAAFANSKQDHKFLSSDDDGEDYDTGNTPLHYAAKHGLKVKKITSFFQS